MVSSPVVLDAGVMIGFLQRNDAHHSDAVECMAKVAREGHEIVISTVTYGEFMTGVVRFGAESEAEVASILSMLPRLRFVAVGRHVALAAAHIRSQFNRLSLPDAIVAATAVAVGADHLITTDHDFDAIDGAVRLSDFVKR